MGTGIMCGAAQRNGGIVALKKLAQVYSHHPCEKASDGFC